MFLFNSSCPLRSRSWLAVDINKPLFIFYIFFQIEYYFAMEDENSNWSPEDVPYQSCCDICDWNHTNFFQDNKIMRLNEREILSYRFDYNIKTLCYAHYQNEIHLFPLNQKTCVDPQSRHKKIIRKDLVPVSLSLARDCKSFTETRLVPGTKLCKNCLKFVKELIETSGSDHAEANISTQP